MSDVKQKKIPLVVGTLLMLVFASLWFANPQQVAHSGLSGSIALHEMSQKSVPYQSDRNWPGSCGPI